MDKKDGFIIIFENKEVFKKCKEMVRWIGVGDDKYQKNCQIKQIKAITQRRKNEKL